MDAFQPPVSEGPARPYQWGRALRNVVIVGLGFLVLVGTCIGIAARQGRKLDAASSAYVQATIPSIVRSWDVNELVASASPELLKGAPRDKMEALFQTFARKLGPLKEIQQSRGDSHVSFWNGKKVTTATYRIDADFMKGPATIDVTLIRHGTQWQVAKLVVNSGLLMQ